MAITITNQRKKLVSFTVDKGFVWNTTIVDVTDEGGNLLPSGKRGMVITLPIVVPVTGEYAMLLQLKGELYKLFPSRYEQ